MTWVSAVGRFGTASPGQCAKDPKVLPHATHRASPGNLQRSKHWPAPGYPYLSVRNAHSRNETRRGCSPRSKTNESDTERPKEVHEATPCAVSNDAGGRTLAFGPKHGPWPDSWPSARTIRYNANVMRENATRRALINTDRR